MENVKQVESNEWVDAVLKLIELTQKNEIKWSSTPIESVQLRGLANEKIIGAFQVEHLGRRLSLIQRSYTKIMPKSLYSIQANAARILGEEEPTRNTHLSIINLQFLDSDGNSLYTVPQVEALEHLMREVKLQKADVRSYLNELLG